MIGNTLNKRQSNRGLLTISFFLLLFLNACTPPKTNQNSVQETPVKNDLPEMTITKFDGSQLNLKMLDKKAVIVFFRPDCDHCQREAEQIKENLLSFKNYVIYFISADPIDQIEKFASSYELKEQPNVVFGWTASENILSNYGSISAPALYIYSDHHQLVKAFDGEIPIGTVLPFL